MYQFTGCPCSVCGKTLTDTDDIVVCPDCGAPYHRACYQAQGACVYAGKHGTGFEWTPPASAQPEHKCPNCGAPNPESAQRCSHCGYVFGSEQAAPPPRKRPESREAGRGRKPSEGSGQPPRREGGRDFRSQQGKPPYGKRPYDKERRACGSGEERGPRKPYAERTASQGHRSRDRFSNSHSPGGGRSSGRTAPYAHSRPVKKGKGSFRKREG